MLEYNPETQPSAASVLSSHERRLKTHVAEICGEATSYLGGRVLRFTALRRPLCFA